jgi:microcystin-dependent protein
MNTRTAKGLDVRIVAALIAASGCAAALGAQNGAPFSNTQPSLAVSQVTTDTGIFPSPSGGSGSGDMLGFVYDFAGNFAPGGSLAAQGQLLPISQNTALFSLLGTTYGGNGVTNFALPNLAGKAVIGAGGGAPLGIATGSATVSLSSAQMPGASNQQPFSNVQPSLPLETLIATSGVFPSQSGGAPASFLGQIATFAGNFVPGGWSLANGSLLPIATNQALFSILGTTYGGNGTTTFALPNLTGRAAVGASSSIPLGSSFGSASTLLTNAQVHGTPVSNYQPSLAVNYIIAVSGIFPSLNGGLGFNPTTPTLGEISAFAGTFAPAGWAFAHGQLLTIASNPALFSILGTTYGGNGTTNFALPDLDGRTLVGTGGSGNDLVGEVLGNSEIILSAANLPIPEPDSCALILAGLGLLGAATRRHRVKPA